MKVIGRKKFDFSGHSVDHNILIGNHGSSTFDVDGTFDLSGIIYSPKNTVTLRIKGDGKIVFKGVCARIVIKSMKGNCTLDLTQLVCNELRCELIGERATIVTGKVRSISPAFLDDDAVLQISSHPLILNYSSSGNAKIVFTES